MRYKNYKENDLVIPAGVWDHVKIMVMIEGNLIYVNIVFLKAKEKNKRKRVTAFSWEKAQHGAMKLYWVQKRK